MGRLETGLSQDIPLSVKLADATNTFGIYFKFFIRLEPEEPDPSFISTECLCVRICAAVMTWRSHFIHQNNLHSFCMPM